MQTALLYITGDKYNMYIILIIALERLKKKSIRQVIDLTHLKYKRPKNRFKDFKKLNAKLNILSKIEFFQNRYNLQCMNCALVLFYLSKRFGIDVTLKMGMHHVGRFLSGHAWLEYDNQPIDLLGHYSQYKIILEERNNKNLNGEE